MVSAHRMLPLGFHICMTNSLCNMTVLVTGEFIVLNLLMASDMNKYKLTAFLIMHARITDFYSFFHSELGESGPAWHKIVQWCFF